jgi:hypothetical protein
MEELAVITGANLVDWRGVEINKDGTRDIFAAASLREDSIELTGVVEGRRVRIRATVLLQAMFEEVPCAKLIVNTCHRFARRLTAPKHCFRAAYQPARYGDGGSI